MGHSKTSALKVFSENKALLAGLVTGDLTSKTLDDTEEFVCKIFKASDAVSINDAHVGFFMKLNVQEKLSPAQDALHLHIARSHFQANIWMQADKCQPDIDDPTKFGWKESKGGLILVLMHLPPVPTACLELTSCRCKTSCMTLRCKCRKPHLPCANACQCYGSCNNFGE